MAQALCDVGIKENIYSIDILSSDAKRVWLQKMPGQHPEERQVSLHQFWK